MKKIIPNTLKKGMKVGIIAPSDIAGDKDLEDINKSVLLMESIGLEVKFGKYVFSNSLGYGETARRKAEDINEMFKDKEVGAIFCVRGGEDSNITFDYIDYDLIQKNPKIICGFSDNTSILNVINDKTGIITYHGPTFKSLTSWETEYAYRQVVDTFIKGISKIGEETDEYKTIKEGKVEGELIGGNITLFSRLVTGKYKVDISNKILFLEELGVESSPEVVNRELYYMKQNGVFDKIKGLWIGNYDHISGITLEKILLDIIEYEKNKYTFPIIKSNNFGHIDKKAIIPIGVMAEINTKEDKKIKLLEDEVKNV